jgi:DNA-binding NarL/FixJ family response regulator
VADPLTSKASGATVDDVVVLIGQPAEHRPNGSQVLVIGKNRFMTEWLVSVLAERGFEPRMPASGTDLQDAVEWRPQVGLLEIGQVDKKAGIELIGVVGQSDVAVAVMNDELDPLSLDECVGAGASAVIETRSRMTDLIAVLKRLTADEVIVDSELTQLATDHRNRANASRLAPFAMLTAREKSVLAELMNGHRAEAIAKNSRVSISTVRSQIKAILQKLGVNCQLAAVAMAREAGWEKELADP